MERQKEQEKQVFTSKDFDIITEKIGQATPKVTKIFSNIKSMTAIVGTTGCGKSSLINYLIKTNLTYCKKGGGKYQISIFQDKNQLYPSFNELLPKIGNLKESCTTLPDIYNNYYVDFAGWFDTRSSIQEVINGFTNSTIFSPGKQIKIIIMIEVNQLQIQRGSVLVDIIQRLMELFQLDFGKIINSILLVISKVKLSQWTIQDIESQITQISSLNKNLNQTTQFLFKTLIQKKRIALFPNPDEIKDHIQIIQYKLKELRPTILSHNGCVSLSHKAIKVINSSLSCLNEDLLKMGNQFAEQINKFNLEQTPGGFSQNSDAIFIAIQRLKTSEHILRQELKICLTFQRYLELLSQLARKLQASNQIVIKMKRNFTMINFYMSINKNAKIDSRFMQVIANKLTQTILALQTKRNKLISQQEKKRLEQQFQYELKERQIKLQKERQQAQAQMKIFQKQLDQDLKRQQKAYRKQMSQYQQQRFIIQRELQELKKNSIQKKNQEENQIMQNFKTIIQQVVLPLVMPKFYSFLNLFRNQD